MGRQPTHDRKIVGSNLISMLDRKGVKAIQGSIPATHPGSVVNKKKENRCVPENNAFKKPLFMNFI